MATELDPVLSFRAAIASEIICNKTTKKNASQTRDRIREHEQKPAIKPIQQIPHQKRTIKKKQPLPD
jgi:hypothetical protein